MVIENIGVAGFLEGFNSWQVSDEKLRMSSEGVPVLEFTPTGISSGPMDAGGWHWIFGMVAAAAFILATILQ